MDTKTIKAIGRAAFPDYTGRKFRVYSTGTVVFSDTNWGGGTRSYYTAVRLGDGKTEPMADYAPWANPVEGRSIFIPAGFAVVEHSYFCGRDCGLRIHLGIQHNADLVQTGRGEVLRHTQLTAQETEARKRLAETGGNIPAEEMETLGAELVGFRVERI